MGNKACEARPDMRNEEKEVMGAADALAMESACAGGCERRPFVSRGLFYVICY